MMIRTRRLLLRPPFFEDWRELHAMIADEGTVRMLASAPWPYLPEHARMFCMGGFDPLAMRFLIALPGAAGAPIIGGIGIELRDEEPELGYWIARDYRRRGFASEAVAAVLDAAAVLGADRVVAGHYLDNPASGAVLRQAGFAETGEVRPAQCMGRGGDFVLARRYACDVRERAWAKVSA